MFIWKFLVPSDRWYADPDDSSREYKGCIIAVVAPDSASARKHAERFMAENGHDIGWLKVAKVLQVPIVDGAVAAYAEV